MASCLFYVLLGSWIAALGSAIRKRLRTEDPSAITTSTVTYPKFDLPDGKELECMNSKAWLNATGSNADQSKVWHGYEYEITRAAYPVVHDIAMKFLKETMFFVLVMNRDTPSAGLDELVDSMTQANRGVGRSQIQALVQRFVVRGVFSNHWNAREYLNAAINAEEMLRDGLAKLSEDIEETEEEYAAKDPTTKIAMLAGIQQKWRNQSTGYSALKFEKIDLNYEQILHTRLKINTYCKLAKKSDGFRHAAFNTCERSKAAGLPFPPITKFGALTDGWVQWNFVCGGRKPALSTDATIDERSQAKFALRYGDLTYHQGIYANQDIEMSPRELLQQFDQQMLTQGLDRTEALRNPEHFPVRFSDVLQWASGGNVHTLKNRSWPDHSLGYVAIAKKLGMQMRAGPSGHTNKLTQYAQYLGFEVPELFLLRLAIVAYFGVTHDHSFLEVMLGAKDAADVLDFPHDSKILRADQVLPELTGHGQAYDSYQTSRSLLIESMVDKPSPDCIAACPGKGKCD